MRRALMTSVAVVAVAGAVILVAGGEEGPSDEDVIREWVDTLRAGDTEEAAELFALPATVANGTQPVELTTREEVVGFNEALPCGARLVGVTEPSGDGTVGTFELTERPGGDCGPAIGSLARTLFVIRDGRIAEWRRLDDPIESGPLV